jgi:hypothetical protein
MNEHNCKRAGKRAQVPLTQPPELLGGVAHLLEKLSILQVAFTKLAVKAERI